MRLSTVLLVVSGVSFGTYAHHAYAAKPPVVSRSRGAITQAPFRTWQVARRNPSESTNATLLSFSPDGKTLVLGGQNTLLQFWDVATGKRKEQLKQRFESTYAFSFSPNGKLLAIGSPKMIGVSIWDTASGKKVRTLALPFPQSKGHHIQDAVFSPDGKFLYANPDGNPQVWDVASGRLIRRLLADKKQFGFALSPDGKKLVTGVINATGDDNCPTKMGLRWWDVPQGKLTKSDDGLGGWPLRFSPDGGQLVWYTVGALKYPDGPRRLDGALARRNQKTDDAQFLPTVKISSQGVGDTVDFSPDGRWLAVAHDDGRFSLFDGRTRKDIKTYSYIGQTVRQSGGSVLAVKFSPDGKVLATSSQDGKVRLWRVNAVR